MKVFQARGELTKAKILIYGIRFFKDLACLRFEKLRHDVQKFSEVVDPIGSGNFFVLDRIESIRPCREHFF